MTVSVTIGSELHTRVKQISEIASSSMSRAFLSFAESALAYQQNAIEVFEEQERKIEALEKQVSELAADNISLANKLKNAALVSPPFNYDYAKELAALEERLVDKKVIEAGLACLLNRAAKVLSTLKDMEDEQV